MTENQAATHQQPQLSLLSLPPEMMAQIVSLIEIPAALSLARAFNSCDLYVKARIWSRLTIPLRISEISTAPASTGTGDDNQAFEVAEEHRRRSMMVARLSEIMKQAAGGTSRLVRVVSATIQPGASAELLALLQLVSARLRCLILGLADPPPRHPDFASDRRETLCVQMISSGITFPSLSYLRLHAGAVQYLGFIPLLCNSAPGLRSLDLDLTWGFPNPPQGMLQTFPPYAGETQITSLRLAFSCEHVDRSRHRRADALISLLERCPRLKRLSVVCDESDGQDRLEREALCDLIFDRVKCLEELQDLYWSPDHARFRRRVESELAVQASEVDNGSAFPSLRRLLLEVKNWSSVFGDWPALTKLEVVVLCAPSNEDPLSLVPKSSIGSTSTHLLTAAFAQHLRDTPRLRGIHMLVSGASKGLKTFDVLDAIERDSSFIGLVCSASYGRSDLLHVSFRGRYQEIVYKHCAPPISIPRPSASRVTDRAGKGRSPNKPKALSKVTTHFTSFEQRAIPIDIIHKMLRAGRSLRHWNGRAVAVKDAGWRVLTAGKAKADQMAAWKAKADRMWRLEVDTPVNAPAGLDQESDCPEVPIRRVKKSRRLKKL